MTPLAAALALLLGASPFKAEQPSVRAGNEKLRAADPAAALDRYQEAERAVGAHPEIEFDRGNALYAQGKAEEARAAWARAAEADRTGRLASRALQNSGNALDAAGDREGAVRAFSEALRRDPGNEDARYNLEVLLRRKPPPQRQPQDQKDQKDQKGQPKGPQQGAPQEKPEPQPGAREEQAKEQPRPQAGQRPGEEGQARPPPAAGDQQPAEPGSQGEPRQSSIGTQDAEKLLDAMRARERNMPLQAAPRKDARRRDVEKDW